MMRKKMMKRGQIIERATFGAPRAYEKNPTMDERMKRPRPKVFPSNSCEAIQFSSLHLSRAHARQERRAFVSMMTSGRAMRLPIGLMVFVLLLPNAFAALSMEVRPAQPFLEGGPFV